ncbi:putative semialdehyde dehydrogenase protein [Fulvimarina pelagi HTCC2506]|uniref:Putative semialdehyde dehydrogenase protein n=1 Tax=Fulvimarina pelagi HTCC2506 TaxID=314231 RepID=Q0G5L2_9HYPH|nr:aldehyde dehydrogenase (NADP(+)) [Fulvimarina pelagi]EAU43052.1 putative semialdehyde dehydrogenase protein [Fulvimarina pelagi HTCC2506]
MTLDLTGKHLIAGEWVGADQTFKSQPLSAEPRTFSAGTPDLVDRAAEAAEDAFWTYAYSSRETRAAFLEAIAEEIEKRGDAITEIGTEESGLPAGRLQGERGRTTGQLKLFAKHIREGAYLDRRTDPAMPDRPAGPRPELKMIQRPIGPVAVFGASNFPLAFSTAGGDTAAALAAGCPVVVKGHEAHPGTGEIVAQAIHAAIEACGIHPGVFSLVQGGSRAVGERLVTHPLIKAVGFTGSLGAGRALYDLCAQRPEPIPFFGELGSVNPVFAMPEALKARGEAIGTAWVGSLTMGAGQFCTNPGLVFVKDGPEADNFVSAAVDAAKGGDEQVMLTDGIAAAYRSGAEKVSQTEGVKALVGEANASRHASPYILETTGKVFEANEALAEEVFGPLGIVVRVEDDTEMERIARKLHGQLTVTLQMDDGDAPAVGKLVPILERKAGRLLANGFPTGVEVADAMVHGGPYPASTNFGATSVGTLAIRRFLRPVCYQNMPDSVLNPDLQ